jgi:hypothetical protein
MIGKTGLRSRKTRARLTRIRYTSSWLKLEASFRERLRVGEDRSDQWQYLKDGRWKIVPPDIIKEEDTPDHLPVLFINKNTGDELCFFVPKGGL